MENGLFSVPIDMAGRNSVTMDCSTQRTPNSLVQLDSFNLFNLNHHNQTLVGFSMPPTLQGEPISDLHANVHMANRSSFMNSDALVASFGRNVGGDALPGCSRSAGNTPFEEQFGGGISDYALATLVDTRSGLQENLNNLAISGPSSYPLEELRSFVSNDCTNALNSSLPSSLNYGCGEVFGSANGKEDFDRFPTSRELGGRAPLRAGFQPHLSIGNLQPNDWTTSNGVNVSEDEPFASARHFSNETRYLHVIQEILAQIASYSLENLDQVRSSSAGFKTGASALFSSSYAMEGGAPPMGFDKSPGLDVQMDPALQKRALEAKRTHLLALLQLVDERYSQCLDEIHTVISAFHAATELDPQIHTRFGSSNNIFIVQTP
ncbi:HOMEOBOX PROTEIN TRANSCRIPTION FACTORS [Salix viminalis]|uniref:HOMEOBOX PROTEIN TRANSCRIPTION FACTORS n=1 Tax=Salix viminalis TaxID=40686 RepID=A0A9Q0NQS2_SALVM|nr:HOMEOBOX PROTEIN TRANSCRIPTION FACTORS [Salix viminalis]